jgi:hypothetical protein
MPNPSIQELTCLILYRHSLLSAYVPMIWGSLDEWIKDHHKQGSMDELAAV